ncbi:EthD family reductase [Halorussus salilacus]|uniref:EthD family reductase n=1 Tax=Halorussus salilacus TaxID=2953750 RepID=UPI00209DDA32|nr:EthD family reductase [Halorussus salilacus]USZ67941.1 EthD family reductase [Halorussus salilacus]
MAVKLVDLLVRKDGLTHEEFVEYWTGDHADLAEQLPGLRKYVTSVPKDPEKAGYDGLLELYFDDTAAIGEAFESEIGQEVQADAANFVDMDEGPTLVVDETVQLDDLDG